MQDWAGAELGHVEAHALLGAAKTGVASAHWPAAGACVAKLGCGAVGIGDRPFATQVVEAVALTVPFIAKFAGKTAIIKMRPALAMLVDEAAIGELGPVFGIQRGQFAKGEVVDDGGEQGVGVGRAAR